MTAQPGKTEYSLTVSNIKASVNYEFVIRSAGKRMNADPVEVSFP